ncbi:hypothetical protein HAX54_021405 [Datura stramonium]|uniref:F-box domain-containing protein n=1 Tax=Datura stramonium TaxID=4076 RepID=A0ABS8UTS8_DATST|nr:hypothetical protein [Datura stramonium]
MKISERKKRKEEKIKEQEHMITCSIPNEMVIEILGRVGCQDLVENLKLVCRKWYSIISNGSFAYSHYFEHMVRKSSSFSQLKTLVISTADGKSVTISSVGWHNNNNNLKDHPFINMRSNPPKDLLTIEYVLGTRIDQMSFQKTNCVNGFVCFWSTHHAHFHICNPMTMEYVTIPLNPYWSSLRRDNYTTIAGLGFCPISYQYKVVVFQHEYGVDVPESETIKGSISTINGNDQSWRPLKWDYHSLVPADSRSAACVDGVLYWCATKNHRYDPYDHYKFESETTTKLVAFDVAKEVSYLIEVPIESLEENVSIEEKGGKICLMTKEMCLESTHILFKGYIAHDDLESLNSWTLEFSVTIYDIYDIHCVAHMSFTNEILMVDTFENTMGFFDVATGKLLDQFRSSTLAAAVLIPYVPSLIPLRHRPIRENFYLDALCRL